MAKRGSEYEQIVGAVCQALEPGAEVEVGRWIEGPDGRRDMDVSIRGTKNGQPYLALIECKDWRTPVGVGVVDALDSKRRDLGAHMSAIYSNSGFTEDASRKARRVGISLGLALKAGDPKIRVLLHRDFYARTRSVDRWSLVSVWKRGRPDPGPIEPLSLSREGKPVTNWFRDKTLEILRDHPDVPEIQAEYAFRDELEFEILGRSVYLIGFVLRLTCSYGWVRQTIREDVSLGSYDLLKGQVIIPDQQTWFLGPFARDKWIPVESGLSEAELGAGSIRIDMTLLRPIAGVDGADTPPLDDLLLEHGVTYPKVMA